MAKQSALSGRLGNVIKNSSLGLVANVLPSVLRFFSRYIFIIYFGDALLGVNSLFADVVLLFSFAEMGIFSAVSFFLYKPIAEKDYEKAQSFLALYRKFNIAIIIMVSVVGLGFLPFLGLIKTPEPIPMPKREKASAQPRERVETCDHLDQPLLMLTLLLCACTPEAKQTEAKKFILSNTTRK